MKQVKVVDVLLQEDKTSKAGRPYKLTTFKDADGEVYKDVYGDFRVGQDLNMEQKTDNYGNPKWEVIREPRPGGGFTPRGKSPEEQHSIMKQVSLKAAVELKSGDVKKTAADVIAIAEVFYAWLKQKDEVETVQAAFPGAQAVHDESLDSLVSEL